MATYEQRPEQITGGVNLVQLGTEPQIRNLHGRILGQTVSIVCPSTSGVYVHVLPSHTEGEIPHQTQFVWGTVAFNPESQDYSCWLRNHPDDRYGVGIWSNHRSLKSALRRVRRIVARHNTQKAERGWTLRAHHLLEPLRSIYPSGLDYLVEEALRIAIEEMIEELDATQSSDESEYEYADL